MINNRGKIKVFSPLTFCKLGLPAIIFFILSSAALAKEAGKFTYVKGSVDVLRAGAVKAIPAVTGESVYEKDIVRSKSASRAQITLSDGSKLNIAQKSRIEISTFEYRPKEKKKRSFFRVFRGKLRAIVTKLFDMKDSAFQVETPTAVAAVRGTDFVLEIPESPEPVETMLAVFDGKVAVRNKNPKIPGEFVLQKGETTRVGKDSPPTKPRSFTPEEGDLFLKETKSEDGDGDKDQGGITREGLFKPDKLPKSRIEPPVTPPITERAGTVPVVIELTFP